MALSLQKVGVTKKEWYDKVKENTSDWDSAWEEEYLSLRRDGIWVTFEKKWSAL